MATRPYNQDDVRAYGEPAGVQLLAALEGAGTDPFAAAQAIREGATIGLTSNHAIALLHRLAASGWITRIKKGLYAINDPLTKLPRAHPFAIGTAVVTPSAVSHWSALQHWGLTEQVPVTVTVSSPTRTFPPSPRGSDRGARPAWMVSGVRYEFVAIATSRFFGVTQVWVNERNRVPVFDRERALLDTFLHFHIFGSLSVALEILETHLADLDIDRLVQYTIRLGVTAVVKRVGWALEEFGVPPDVVAPLRTYPVKGYSPLDPSRPARGGHNPTWHVTENLQNGR